jgi:hypothetical protein
VHLIRKTTSTRHNSIEQNCTEQDITGKDKNILEIDMTIIFIIFENKMSIFIFLKLVLWAKSCHVVQ